MYCNCILDVILQAISWYFAFKVWDAAQTTGFDGFDPFRVCRNSTAEFSDSCGKPHNKPSH